MAEQFLSIISDFGYLGIFLLMTLESTVFPIPSELVMIPAGYLAYKGQMNPYLAILAGTLGSLCGAMINYTASRKWGREFLVRNGKYLLLNEQKLHKMDVFFAKYGEIGTFFGRLLPVVRHYISIPAGLTSMNVARFSLFTTLGAAIWMVVLVWLGYFLGDNQKLVKEYLHLFLVAIAVMVIGYAYYRYKKGERLED